MIGRHGGSNCAAGKQADRGSRGGFTAAPAKRSFDRADWSSVDRFVTQVSPQIVRERFRAGVATRRMFLQTLEANRFQMARNAAPQEPRLYRVLVQYGDQSAFV